MSNKVTCYYCINYRLCSLRRSVERAIKDHMFMVKVETGETPNVTEIYGRLAEVCKEWNFKEEC